MTTHEIERQMKGYGLLLAEILYHMPDYPQILQSYIWQAYDLAPSFPELQKFLDFWNQKLDANVHSVRYSHKYLVGPSEWRALSGEIIVH